MVFNVSGNMPSQGKVDPEKQASDSSWEVSSQSSSKGLLTTRRAVARRSLCCIVLPWFLLCLALIMLGCVSSWGWKEHTKLQDLLKQNSKMQFIDGPNFPPLNFDPHFEKTPDDTGPGDVIPYGNDGLESPDGESDEEAETPNDDVDYHIDDPDDVYHPTFQNEEVDVTETPKTTTEKIAFFFRFFPYFQSHHAPGGRSEDKQRVTFLHYRIQLGGGQNNEGSGGPE